MSVFPIQTEYVIRRQNAGFLKLFLMLTFPPFEYFIRTCDLLHIRFFYLFFFFFLNTLWMPSLECSLFIRLYILSIFLLRIYIIFILQNEYTYFLKVDSDKLDLLTVIVDVALNYF